MTKLPVRTALLWIWGSTIVFSGGIVLALQLKQKWNSEVRRNPKFVVQTIVQKCDSVESLSTDYLAECLGLSLDRSYTLFQRSTKEMEGILEASPLIKTASVSKILPSGLYIEYTLRQPIALLHDLQNTAFDNEGVLFPLQPFRTPKVLPEVAFGERMEQKMSLALEVLAFAGQTNWEKPLKRLSRIDLSRADRARISQREMIFVFNTDSDMFLYLRLPVGEWRERMALFLKIPPEHLTSGVIDLRLPLTAYVSKETKR
jgi:hypothetical protein